MKRALTCARWVGWRRQHSRCRQVWIRTLHRKNWKNAAEVASNLSELYLTIGDVTQALAYAEQSVELADRSGDAFERMVDRTTLADALHQAGRLAEAEATFREAEEMQKKCQPEFPLLYSLQVFATATCC